MPPSPYINQFLSADTIVPDPANPQDLNRFSYVRNNPLKYTDPSGHACVEGTSSCVDPLTNQRRGSLRGWTGIGGITVVNSGEGGRASSGSNPCTSVICLPTPTPRVDAPIPPTVSNGPQMVYPNIPDVLQDAGELFAESFNILHFLVENGRYPYKLIRSLTVNPVQEATISASLQLLADSNNELTISQRAGRGLWAAGEAAIIDILSLPIIASSAGAGALIASPTDGVLPIGESLGASAGYVIGAVTSNSIMVNTSERWVTPWVYTTFNLYDPFGN